MAILSAMLLLLMNRILKQTYIYGRTAAMAAWLVPGIPSQWQDIGGPLPSPA
jgi:hypothetical protein